jgi:hypothetical protein
VKQLTVVAPDQTGLLAEVTEVLGRAGVNIETLDAETAGDSAVIVFTVDRYDDALRALSTTPYHVVTEDVLLVQIEDRAGSLAEVARRFSDAGVHVRSLRFLRRSAGVGVVAIAVDRTAEALELVKDIRVG